MVGLELIRMALLLFAIIYFIRILHMQILSLVSTALIISLAGKVIFAFNGKSSHVKR